MSVIWIFMVLISVCVALLCGKADCILTIFSNSTKSAIENMVVIAGMMCLWSGIFNIIKETKTVKILAKMLRTPLLKLFNKKEITDSQLENISLNVTSNILGIGNAATIYGLKAVEEMQDNNLDKKTATNNMTTLAVMNSASIQLIPTTMTTLRAMNGVENPNSIIIPVWIVSGVALIAGIVSIKILNKRR